MRHELTQEEYDLAFNTLDEFDKNLNLLDSFFGFNFTNSGFSKSSHKLISSIREKIKEKYEEQYKLNSSESEKCECTNTSCECNKIEPARPSENIPGELQVKFAALAKEYVDTVIEPYSKQNNLSKETLKDIFDGLFEYSCWLYDHK